MTTISNIIIETAPGIPANADDDSTASVKINEAINRVNELTDDVIGANLGYNSSSTNGVITSDTGTDATIPGGTTVTAGLITGAMVSKLDGIETGATADQTGLEIVAAIDTELGGSDWQSGGGAGATNLDYTSSPSNGVVTSDTGSDATIPLATTVNAGLFEPAEKIKLTGVEDNATADQTGAEIVTAIDTQLGSSTWQGGGGSGATNLGYTVATRTVTSSSGTDAVLPLVTTSDAGLSSAADKAKLDGVEAGATADQTGLEIVNAIDTQLGSSTWQGGGGSGATNLAYTAAVNSGVITSSSGTNATIPAADGTNAGLFLASEKTKLTGIESNATADQTGSEIVSAIDAQLGNTDWQTQADTNLGYTPQTRTITSSTGANVALPIATTSEAGLSSAADKTKLDGIEEGAEANPTNSEIVASIDAQLGSDDWQSLESESAPALGADLVSNGRALKGTSYSQIPDATLGTGTHTFNYLNGDMQRITATGNITIAFTGLPAGNVAALIIDAVNWGAFAITLPAGMLFAGGTAPTFTAAGVDRLVVIKDRDETLSMFVVGAGVA